MPKPQVRCTLQTTRFVRESKYIIVTKKYQQGEWSMLLSLGVLDIYGVYSLLFDSAEASLIDAELDIRTPQVLYMLHLNEVLKKVDNKMDRHIYRQFAMEIMPEVMRLLK